MPSLPPDLERLIFEMAALQDTDHDNRVRLMLVAKRVYEWIRPILYRVAIAKAVQGRLTIQNWGNTQITEVAPFVRHLFIDTTSSSHVIELLSTFHNVENLAVMIFVSSQLREFYKKMNDLPLRMCYLLPLHTTNVDEATKYCPAFRNLTHLQLMSLELPTWEDCKLLAEFPNLTHLCLAASEATEGGVLLHLLENCPSLRALICKWPTIEIDDPRFLVLLQGFMGFEDVIEDWKRSSNGGIGTWELADIIIGARKDGLFEDNSSFTFFRTTWMDRLNEDGIRWYKKWLRGSSRYG